MFKQKSKTPTSVKRVPIIAALGMAVLVSLVSIFGRSNLAAAATNNTINFQARLLTAAGAVVPDGNYNVEFKLYNALTSSGSSQGSCTGDSACLWVETRTSANTVRVVNGYLTVNLGSVNAFPTTINWDQQLWLTMNIGGTAVSPSWDGEMSPRLQLTGVPYAFRAGALAGGSGANTTVLDTGTPSGNNTIHLPAASGTVCLQSSSACGFASSTGSGSYIQNGTSLQTGANFAIQSAGTGSVVGVLQGANGQTADLFDVQTWNGTSATNVFSVNNVGAVTLNGTGTTNFTTPQGSSVPTKISVPLYDPGSFGQVIAMGVPSTANATARVMSLLDGRTGTHQPTIAVFNPGESDAIGFNWNGANNLANVQTIDVTSGSTDGVMVRSGNVSAGNGGSGIVYLESGSVAGGAGGYASGNVVLQSGNAAGTTANSGNVQIDVGTATGTKGTISVGATNATSINVGNSSATTAVTGVFNVSGGASYSLNSTSTGSIASNGAITITAGGGSTWSTSSGNLTVQAAGTSALNLQTGGAGTVALGDQNTTTINIGRGSNIARTINIGTAGTSTAQAITIGSTGSTSTTTIQGGTGSTAIALTAGTNGSINATTSGTGNINLTTASNIVAKSTSAGTSGFQVQGASTTVLNVDTTNNRVGVNTTAPGRVLDVTWSDSSINTPALRLLQNGTGDASMEFNATSAGTSIYLGQDASNAGAFTINSSSAASASSTITYVQSASSSNSAGATTIAQAYSGSVTAGNTLVVTASFDTTLATTIVCSDSLGNTWTTVTSQIDTTAAQGLAVCYARTASTGADTVTVTFKNGGGTTVSAGSRFLALAEYSGVSSTTAVDNFAGVGGATGTTATDNITSGSALANVPNDLSFGAVVDTSGANSSIAAGTGFTQRQLVATEMAIQDKQVPSSGSVASTNTFGTAHRYDAIEVLLRPQSGSVSDTFNNALFTLSQSGSAKYKNSANTTTAFQIQNASGTGLLDADTTNSRIGIGTTAPAYTLDVAGDVNISSGSAYRINGTSICTSSGCTASSTSAILNQNAAQQASSNFWISGTGRADTGFQSPSFDTASGTSTLQLGMTNATAIELGHSTFFASGANRTLNIAAPGSGNGNNLILQAGNGAGTNASGGSLVLQGGNNTGTGTAGAVIVKPQTDTANAFQIQNAAGTTNILNVGTTNSLVTLNGDINFTGLQPASTSGAGTAAASWFLTAGAGGNTTGTTGQTGGNGSTMYITGGNGGTAPSGSTNGSGGNVIIAGGTAGAGAGGAGFRGNVILQPSGGVVGIGTISPNTAYKIDATGDINISSGSAYRINGTALCTSSGCTPASGSSFYIQNQFSTVQSANMRIQTTSDTVNTVTLQSTANQNNGTNQSDLLEFQSSTGGLMAGVTPIGTIWSAPISTLAGVPTTARMFIQANSTASNSVVIRTSALGTGVASDAGPLRIQNKDGSIDTFDVNGDGSITSRLLTDSATAFQIQNASASSMFNVNTSSPQITVGSTTTGVNTIQYQTVSGSESRMVFQSGATAAISTSNIQYTLSKRGDNTSFWLYGYDGTSFVNYLKVDGANKYVNLVGDGTGSVGIGTNTPSRELDVKVSNTSTNALPVIVEQGSTGDAGIEIKNTSANYYAGIDTSDSSAFKVNSYYSASTEVLGADMIGYATDSGDPGTMSGTQFTAGKTGTITSLSAYVGSTSVTGSGQMAIYTDNGSNVPGTKLASSASVTVTTGWNTYTIASTSVTAGTKYWLMYNAQGTSAQNNMNADWSQGNGYFVSQAFGTWPSSWPAGGTSYTGTYSMYAPITTSAPTDNWSTQLLRLSQSGALSIQNTTNSTTAFQVLNDNALSILTVDTTNSYVRINGPNATQSGGRLYFGDLSNVYVGEYGNANTDQLALFGSSGLFLWTSNNNNALTISSNATAQVGINTAAPSEQLTVDGNLLVRNADSQIRSLRIRTNGTAADVETGGVNMVFSVWSSTTFASGQTTVLQLNTSGQMVYSSATAITSTQGTVCINTSTKVMQYSTGTTCSTSSIRYKKDVQNLPDNLGLSAVMAMRPVTFQYITGDGSEKVGFIAEEMQNIVPEVVNYDSNGLPNGIDYEFLTANIVKGMQQQQVEIQDLQKGLWDGGVVSNDATFNANVTFNGGVDFKGAATFEGKTNFMGQVMYNPDAAGTVVIPKGQTTATVTFNQPYDNVPEITATPSDFVSLKITNKTVNGFTITMHYPSIADTSIDWVATQTATPTVATSTTPSNAPTVATSGP